MKIEVLPDYNIVLKEVFSGVLFVSPDREEFGICMRDSGFEFRYAGTWYEAKNGTLKPFSKNIQSTEQVNQFENGSKTRCRWGKTERCEHLPLSCPDCTLPLLYSSVWKLRFLN